jgi:hypothetical protein
MLARATRNANVRAACLIFMGAGYLRAADHTIRGLLVECERTGDSTSSPTFFGPRGFSFPTFSALLESKFALDSVP